MKKRAMPDGYPCKDCKREMRQSCSTPCPRFKIYYAEFMHRCRVACGRETPEKEARYKAYVALQMMADKDF